MKPTLVQAILHPQFRAYSSATACRHCKPTAQHRQAWPYEPPLCSPLLPSFVTDSPDNPHCPQSSAAPWAALPHHQRGRWSRGTSYKNTLWKDDKSLSSLTFLLFPTSKACSFIPLWQWSGSYAIPMKHMHLPAHTPFNPCSPKAGKSGGKFVSICAC